MAKITFRGNNFTDRKIYMYTIISGTNRPGSNTIKIARQYHHIMEQKGAEITVRQQRYPACVVGEEGPAHRRFNRKGG